MRAFILAVLLAAGPACGQQLTVESVEVRQSQIGPAVMLRVGDRARPLSHDLMHNILTSLDARVTRVVVTLHDGIYYGELRA